MTRFGRSRAVGSAKSLYLPNNSLLRPRSRRYLLTPPIPPLPASPAAVWWANDLLLADGDAVSTWVDRVNQNSLTGTSTTRPLFDVDGAANHPVVEFDGTDDYLSTSTVPSSASSGCMIAVMRWDDPTRAGSIQTPFGASNTTGNTRFVRATNSGTGGLARFYRNNAGGQNVIDGSTALPTTLMVLEYSSTGSAYEIRVNNVVETPSIAAGSNNGNWFSTVTLDRFYMGTEITTTNRFPWDGGIAYLGVFDSQLSSSDRSALYSWIADYYQIAITL